MKKHLTITNMLYVAALALAIETYCFGGRPLLAAAVGLGALGGLFRKMNGK